MIAEDALHRGLAHLADGVQVAKEAQHRLDLVLVRHISDPRANTQPVERAAAERLPLTNLLLERRAERRQLADLLIILLDLGVWFTTRANGGARQRKRLANEAASPASLKRVMY